MPTIREELAIRTAAAIALFGQTFEWNGGTYPCVRRDRPTALEMQDAAGFIERTAIWLVVAKSDLLLGFPKVGDPVDNGARQIKEIAGDKDPAAAQLVITTGSFDV